MPCLVSHSALWSSDSCIIIPSIWLTSRFFFIFGYNIIRLPCFSSFSFCLNSTITHFNFVFIFCHILFISSVWPVRWITLSRIHRGLCLAMLVMSQPIHKALEYKNFIVVPFAFTSLKIIAYTECWPWSFPSTWQSWGSGQRETSSQPDKMSLIPLFFQAFWP